MALEYTANERWYLTLTRHWARRLRAGEQAGPHHDPAPDIAFAEQVLGLRPGMRVLDLAAGWGRTSLELARRGYRVVAFDLSPELVALGRERAAAAGLPVRFVQGTVRALPALERFDAVCAFYDDALLSFAEEADNLRALRGVASALVPGGGLLFGTTDCPLRLPPCQRTLTRDGYATVEETITFDAVTRVGRSVRVQWDARGGVTRAVRTRRHYRPQEAAALLDRAGLALVGAWCGYDLALPYGSRPEGMVLAARRLGADQGSDSRSVAARDSAPHRRS